MLTTGTNWIMKKDDSHCINLTPDNAEKQHKIRNGSIQHMKFKLNNCNVLKIVIKIVIKIIANKH